MTKISIVMPVYNTGIYLDKAIKSIYNQTFQEWELICVNNNSSDCKTNEILDEWSERDERIRVILEKRKGAGNARNSGLLIVEGEYTIFLDADDIFDLRMLEKMYGRIRESNAMVCICGYKSFYDDENGRHIAHHNIMEGLCDSNDEQYINSVGTNPWTKLCRTDFLRRNNIQFQNLDSSNDVYFSIMVLHFAKGKITFINEMLVMYRQNIDGQISSNRNPNDLYFAVERAMFELKSISEYDISLEKQLYYYLIKSGFYELGKSINKEKNQQFYDNVRNLLDKKRISFTSSCANNYVDLWLNNEYESGWIRLAGDYKRQIEVFNYKWDIEKIINKPCVLWGFGKRGRAFWEWVKEKHDVEIAVYDEGFNESATDRDCFISDVSWKKKNNIVIASNQMIYSIAISDKKCKSKEILNLEELCPL